MIFHSFAMVIVQVLRDKQARDPGFGQGGTPASEA